VEDAGNKDKADVEVEKKVLQSHTGLGLKAD
jgi:hypothetical protein